MIRDRAYLDWLRSERCVLTGQYGSDYDAVDPMHIGTLGRGIKSPDDEALPVLHSLHVLGHQRGEVSLFREMLPDTLLRCALRAWAREMYRDYLNEAGKRRRET